jgi:uncharacterized membrane-anchored protein
MKRILLYVLLGLQIFGLVALYGYRASGLGAPVVLLETVPVDPRDLLRGDYIILGYKIGVLPDKTPDGESWREGETVYVTLRQNGAFWETDYVSQYDPGEGRYICGTVRNGRIVFDLEKYFVPEGKGRPPGKITVEVAVRPYGRAQIKQLYSDGKPWP